MALYKVGCTGHRKLTEEARAYGLVVDFLFKLAKKRKEEHGESLEVNSGMAFGFDQLVCKACINLEIPFVAVVPCDSQDSLWPELQKNEYKKLLSSASRTVIVSPGAYAAWKMHTRNRWIVENSKEMIVFWDGLWTGGTGNCMKLLTTKFSMPWFNTYKKT